MMFSQWQEHLFFRSIIACVSNKMMQSLSPSQWTQNQDFQDHLFGHNYKYSREGKALSMLLAPRHYCLLMYACTVFADIVTLSQCMLFTILSLAF